MLIHIDSFDSYNVVGDLTQTYTVYNVSYSTTAGRFGGGAITGSGNNQYISYVFPSSQSEIWTGFAFQPNGSATSISSQTNLLNFISASGIEAAVSYNPTFGIFQIWKGQQNFTSLGISSNINGSGGLWHWIDIHYLISSTVGIFEIWVDNIQLIVVSGVNTTEFNNSSFNMIQFGTGVGSMIPFNIDDFYILNTSGSHNTTRLGDSRINTLLPTSDAGPNNGTPSTAGPHYPMVNGTPWQSTNNVTVANIIGYGETYGMASLPSTPPNIYGIQVLAIAEKSDAGNLTIETMMESNGVIANGANVQLLTTYTHITGIFETDPNNGNPWTYSNVNIANCGIQITV